MVDDASCTYAEANFDCDGNCIVDCWRLCWNSSLDDCGGNGEILHVQLMSTKWYWVMLKCGVCDGAGIAEGACDCDGNVDLG